MIIFIINRDEIRDLNAFTESIFWKSKYDDDALKIFDHYNKSAMKGIIAYFSLALTIVLVYLTIPITGKYLLDSLCKKKKKKKDFEKCFFFVTVLCRLFFILEYIGQNGSQRELPFKIWFDFSFLKPKETPYYEILYVIEVHIKYNEIN